MKLLTFIGFGWLALCLFCAGAVAQAASPSDTLKIGAILILSGEGSSVGIASQRGIDMAIEAINHSGGVLGKQLEMVYQDDHGDPKGSIAAFHQLVDVTGVHFILGPTWSNQGIALIKPADKKKIVMISPSLGVAAFNEGSKFLFTMREHDFLLSQSLAEHVFAQGHRRVALVGAEHVWVKEQSIAFKNRFEELGGKIEVLIEPNPGTTDLRMEALKINNSNVEAVVSTTDRVIIGSLVAKALREMGSKLPFYSITLDQAAIDAAHGGFEGLQFLTSFTPSADFQSAYEIRYKTAIDISADSAYDAVMLLAKAIKAVGSTDTEKVAGYLASISSYEGVSGSLKSDGQRGFIKAHVLKTVTQGAPR